MELPSYVMTCLNRLEQAGFAAYAVGGCVRDHLLGLTPHDYDLCTAATPEQMKSLFSHYRLVLAGEKHGTVCVMAEGHPVEITTFRQEGGYQDSRHPDWVRFVTEIDGDLSRRDFTINAMAYSPYRGFADPYSGREDLRTKTLRAVGDPQIRFQEDPLRILRGIRFSVRFGLKVAPATASAMEQRSPMMDQLAQERVFEELCKLLPLMNCEDLLRFTPILTRVIPELAPMVGFDQHTRHHAYDLLTHTGFVLEAVPQDLALRFAALLHDVGKPAVFSLDEQGQGHFPGHAKESVQLANTILLRLKAPTALREEVAMLIGNHMDVFKPEKRLLRRRLSQYGDAGVRKLLVLQKADFASKGTGATTDLFDQTDRLLTEIAAEDNCLSLKDLAVNGRDLMALGYSAGPALGDCLHHLLNLVLDETCPNEKETLLMQAHSFFEKDL